MLGSAASSHLVVGHDPIVGECNWIDRERPIRLIAVTVWGQDKDRQRAQQAGFDAHLTKPADPDVLLRLIDGTLAPP